MKSFIKYIVHFSHTPKIRTKIAIKIPISPMTCSKYFIELQTLGLISKDEKGRFTITDKGNKIKMTLLKLYDEFPDIKHIHKKRK